MCESYHANLETVHFPIAHTRNLMHARIKV